MIESSRDPAWHHQAATAFRKYMVLKSIGTTVFISVFFVAYFHVLNHPATPPTVMPAIWLDHLVSFQPWALPVYLSLWFYVSLVPALFGTRPELYRYGAAMGLMCGVGLSIFYFWPTGAPVPDIDWTRHPDMRFLKSIDASGNACPSLHVAAAFFSGVWLNHLLRRFGGPLWIRMFNGTWCIGIIYSTLAIRQHVAVDAGAGLLLGGLAAWLSMRYRLRTEAAPAVFLPLPSKV